MRKKKVGAARRPKTPHQRSSSMKKWPKWSIETKMMAAVFSQSVLSTARGALFKRVWSGIPALTCDTHRLHGAPLVGGCQQLHLLEDEGQGQQRCVPLNDRAPHYRGAKGDGAAVLDARSLHLQHHVLEGVKLQNAVDNTVVAKGHRVPIRALHW